MISITYSGLSHFIEELISLIIITDFLTRLDKFKPWGIVLVFESRSYYFVLFSSLRYLL